MAYRKKGWVRPPLLHHAPTGQACVYWDNDRITLGAWDGQGVPPAEVMAAYLRKLVELEQRFYAKAAGVPEPNPEDALLVNEAIQQYLEYLKTSVKGYLRPDGTLSQHWDKTRLALEPLAALYGDFSVEQFGPLELEMLQEAMCDHKKWFHGAKEDRPAPWCRTGINTRIAKVRRLFRWLESRRLVPRGTYEHLRSVGGLQKGKSSAPEPAKKSRLVADKEIEIVCQYCSPVVAAMIRIGRLTGMRPSEVCLMRVAVPGAPECGIDMTGDVWSYRPEEHKMEHMEEDRVIFLGPEEQAILQPFIDSRESAEYLFSPKESDDWWRANRWRFRKARETKRYPSEIKQVAKKKAEAAKRLLKKAYLARYTRHGFRLAVKRAIDKAKQFKENVGQWSPYDLRHTRLTEIEREYGVRAAQAVAGHKSMKTTEIYLHEQRELAKVVAQGGRVDD